MKKNQDTLNTKLPASGRITARSDLCTGCGICELACSLYHEKVGSQALSRISIERKYFVLEHDPQVCIQCKWPSCYYECPVKAIKIDKKTNARYIDEELCIGCGKCVKACPLTPGIKTIGYKKVGKKKVYFKCDLCRDREEGPLCVEMCPRNVLSYKK